jgi:hypothetical protein
MSGVLNALDMKLLLKLRRGIWVPKNCIIPLFILGLMMVLFVKCVEATRASH